MRRLVLTVLALLAAGCGSNRSSSSALTAGGPDPRAPDGFDAEFETSKGTFTVRATRAWSPLGVDRFHRLVTVGYYDRTKFFRVIPDYIAQWGMHGDSAVNATWASRPFADEPVAQPNGEATVSFAKGGPNTRSTHLFVNLKDNSARLDPLGFVPIGRVTSGMHVVRALFGEYGGGPPQGPDQGRIAREGNRYLERSYPRLDSIIRARVVTR
jgi:cyclophilin family peptidyl-prolyl cis-trans isomerase